MNRAWQIASGASVVVEYSDGLNIRREVYQLPPAPTFLTGTWVGNHVTGRYLDRTPRTREEALHTARHKVIEEAFRSMTSRYTAWFLIRHETVSADVIELTL